MQLSLFLSRPRIVLALVLLLLTVPAWAGDTASDRASLKGVDSVQVAVENMRPDAERDGLTSSQIQTDVELRLRQSGIKVDSSSPCMLYVRVSTLRNDDGRYAFNILVSLEQPVMLQRNPKIVQPFASTWNVAEIGTAGATRLRDVRSAVIDEVNKFISAYLEENPKP